MDILLKIFKFCDFSHSFLDFVHGFGRKSCDLDEGFNCHYRHPTSPRSYGPVLPLPSSMDVSNHVSLKLSRVLLQYPIRSKKRPLIRESMVNSPYCCLRAVWWYQQDDPMGFDTALRWFQSAGTWIHGVKPGTAERSGTSCAYDAVKCNELVEICQLFGDQFESIGPCYQFLQCLLRYVMSNSSLIPTYRKRRLSFPAWKRSHLVTTNWRSLTFKASSTSGKSFWSSRQFWKPAWTLLRVLKTISWRLVMVTSPR